MDLAEDRCSGYGDRLFMGIFFARLAMRLGTVGKGILDGILTLPLVLPPTVAGFLLLMLFSLKRPLGSFLLENFDIRIVQTWKGCVIAACVIAFPLMYRNARPLLSRWT